MASDDEFSLKCELFELPQELTAQENDIVLPLIIDEQINLRMHPCPNLIKRY